MAFSSTFKDSGSLFIQIVAIVLLAQRVILYTRRQIKRLRLGCKAPKTCSLSSGLSLELLSRRRFQRSTVLSDQGNMHHQFGLTFSTNKFFLGSTIYSIDPENLRTVWSSGFKDWGVEGPRLEMLSPLCGREFITSDGERWKKTREAIRPQFYGPTADAVNLNLIEEHLQHLLRKVPKDGKNVDFQPLLHDLYFDVSYMYLMGEDLRMLPGYETVSTQVIRGHMEYGMMGCRIRHSKGLFKIFHTDRAWDAAREYIWAFADAVVDRAYERKVKGSFQAPDLGRKMQPERRHVIDIFMERWPDRLRLRNGVIQYFIGAAPPVAGVLTNALHLLSLDLQAWTRLKQEALQFSTPFLMDDCRKRKLPYARAVFEEALRLFPFTTLEARSAIRDTILPRGGGPDGQAPILVTKGTMFKANIFSLHRDPLVFGSDCDAFNPDRWNSIKPDRWQFIPFGGGPRICLGKDKGKTEGVYLLIRLAQSFKSVSGRERTVDEQSSMACNVDVIWEQDVVT